MPVVNLDITMTREAALAAARAVAAQYDFADARQAIVFNQDNLTQNYIELEGGGKAAFARLVAGKLYSPYWWDVRLFKAGVVEELSVQFKPDGSRYGFRRRVAETYVRDPATKALSADAALALAKTRARDWNVDFAQYRLLDQSQQTRPSGRVDHQFVFERDETIADARIRLKLAVAGDELTEVDAFVYVPESFSRRFAEMRSANNTIAGFATISAGVLYGFVGCILGALWLLRRRYLEWRPAFVAGLVIAGLAAAALLANTPTAWFAFNTAQDESTFWIRQIGLALLALVGGSLALGEILMAAEGLTRRAFGDHPQLWRAWSRGAGATREIAGRTAGGYLFVPIQLGLIASFYYVTNRYFGWWQPSEQLTDPNILASAMPALTPIANALQAGMLEECLFRAVPLALGALIGAHYGHRTLGIAIAFVVQAVVFGAAHANYPGFPSYSRLVELVGPSLIWAAIFLRYGLIPTIVLHAVFDLVLMSIPLFLIDAPGAGLQRAIVIVAGLVPLIVIAVRRVQAGAFGTLPETLRNRAWVSAPAAPVVVEPAATVGVLDRRAIMLQRMLPLAAVVGIAAWIAFTPWRADTPSLAIDRDAAIAAAATAVAERGVTLGSEWMRTATTRSALDEPVQRQWHAFVWRQAGEGAYRALIGNALAPPLWEVRFAKFAGDVADRAEEWRVTVTGDGRIRQVVHRLPEARPGPELSREDAQSLAERTLFRQLGTDAAMLVLRGADQQQRPARRDWVFAYVDPRVNVGASGEARVQVAVAGDEVVSSGRSLFVPEAWQRAETERDGRRTILRLAGGGIIVVSVLIAIVYAVSTWNKGRCDRRTLWQMALLALAMLLAGGINNWPVTAFQLRTTEPIVNQVALAVLAALGGGVLFALLLGLVGGVGVYYARMQTQVRLAGRLPPWAAGVAAALLTAGVSAALGALVPRAMPVWPDLKLMASAWPWLAAALTGVALVPAIAVTLFLLSVFDRMTIGWTRHVPLAAVIVIAISMSVSIVSGRELAQAYAEGAIEGATTFAFAWLLLRYDLRIVPAFVATGVLLEAVSAANLRATVEAWSCFAITAAVAVILAAWATRYIDTLQPAPRPA
jgi:hypothetical protein